MSIALENVRRDAMMRIASDKELSPAWILVPLVPAIIGTVVWAVLWSTLFGTLASLPTTGPPPSTLFRELGAVIGLLGVLAIVGLIEVILLAFLVYSLVNRRNKHFRRQVFLYQDLMTLLRELATKKAVDVSPSLVNMERTANEARYEETEKSAGLFAVLAVIPILNIAILYVYYFLMRDFYRHERREDLFLDDLNRCLLSLGLPANFPRRVWPTPDRSFALYLVLSILTFGIFSIYWLYALLTDPNTHFRQQAIIEDTLIGQLTAVSV